MAHLILPPAEIVGRATAELVEQAGYDSALVRALNKAQYHMTIGELPIVPTISGFLLPSGTRAGVIHRVSTVHGCDCEAGRAARHCWHAQVICIMEQAAKYTMPRLVKRDTRAAYEAAVAAMDELYS